MAEIGLGVPLSWESFEIDRLSPLGLVGEVGTEPAGSPRARVPGRIGVPALSEDPLPPAEATAAKAPAAVVEAGAGFLVKSVLSCRAAAIGC